LLDLTNIPNLLTNLADIERIVISASLGLSMRVRGVLPSLRESAIIPDVTMMREAVTNVAQSIPLHILLDRIEELFLGDFHLGVGPSRDFDNHVENPIGLVDEEGDVMERRDD
jgi:hypothetical protein